MPYASKQKESEYKKKWYQANKKRHNENARKNTARYRLELNRYVFKYKQSHPCETCGESDPCCLQFHHRDPSKKDLAISRAAQYVWSLDRLEKEIEKCDVLCANCHAKVHCCRRVV